MSEIFSRNEMLWGEETQKLLSQKHVAVFGLGGVGGFAVEALVRAGIGEISIIDFDKVSKSNINRQIIALHSTIGKSKAELFETRLKDINPDLKINTYNTFYTKSLNETIFRKNIDYVVDAIDTLKSKIELIDYCHNSNCKIITSVGAGNRLDPTELKIKDISEIKNTKCPFVKNIIRILDKKSINRGITCVISEEKPRKNIGVKNQESIRSEDGQLMEFTKISPGSVIFVPAVAGYYMAHHVIQSITR